MRSRFALHLRFAHLVQSLDRHASVFCTVLDKHHATTWFQSAHDTGQDLEGVGQFVVHVDQDQYYVAQNAAGATLAE